MHIQDIFAKEGPSFSFEFFPPKTADAIESLYETISELEAYDPASGDFAKFSLAKQKGSGRWTVLFFYPADWTFV